MEIDYWLDNELRWREWLIDFLSLSDDFLIDNEYLLNLLEFIS
jgi:hypothetical protein